MEVLGTLLLSLPRIPPLCRGLVFGNYSPRIRSRCFLLHNQSTNKQAGILTSTKSLAKARVFESKSEQTRVDLHVSLWMLLEFLFALFLRYHFGLELWFTLATKRNSSLATWTKQTKEIWPERINPDLYLATWILQLDPKHVIQNYQRFNTVSACYTWGGFTHSQCSGLSFSSVCHS